MDADKPPRRSAATRSQAAKTSSVRTSSTRASPAKAAAANTSATKTSATKASATKADGKPRKLKPAAPLVADERARKRSARMKLQRAARRPRASDDEAAEDSAGGRLFVSALARGLEVLSAFRARDRALGNLELAKRTGLPKPTISRITHTLTQLGYLAYDARSATYQLGGSTLSLSYVALANLDVRRVARPTMERLADSHNLHVALAMRDKQMMLNIETCEGQGLVGLRLATGSRMPVAVTAIGKAYLAAVADDERNSLMDAIRRQHGEDWPMIVRSVERATRDVAERGFCVSAGEWRKDINAVGAPVVAPGGSTVYALSIGGPAYLMSQEQLDNEYGPAIAAAAQQISAALGGG
ncbi:IclR family transcriptional regulator [Bradyrhizobium sp. 2TAF24]|uniref:IclR family transcriptional regulator n=1 Tax=Bradyrhizobium sp. 2TAF24 TaxID=3233011 RepID=UPI003F8F52B0